jgi:hypothetical protein
MFLFKHCPVILDSGGMLTWLCLFLFVFLDPLCFPVIQF